MNPAVAARLASLEIQLIAELKGYALFVRGDALALVERTPEGFGSIGSTGVMTGRGLAYLVYREGRAVLAAKGGEFPAEDAQIEEVRRFSEDLKSALRS